MQSNRRKAHVLMNAKEKPFPTEWVFLDTETTLTNSNDKTKLHKLKLAGMMSYELINNSTFRQRSEIFTKSKRTAIGYLLKNIPRDKTTYLVAHNLTYDTAILDLYRELPKNGFRLLSLYSKGQVSIIRWKSARQSLTMIDNGNIFHGKLETWGEIFGYPKLHVDFETVKDYDLKVYNKRDIEIMVHSWQAWIEFLLDNECGGFHETVASTAFSAWRKLVANKKIYVHDNQNILQMERQAYHGGRVECFYQGQAPKDTYYYLDVNNMYGFVMSNHEYPTGLQGFQTSGTIKRLIEKLERYSVLAHVKVNTNIPVFITKVKKHIAYPVGTFETFLTTNELLYGLQYGLIADVFSFAWYTKDFIFYDYVQKYYGLRQAYKEQGNKGFAQIAKLFINGLYGKFGQMSIQQRILGRSPTDEIYKQQVLNADTNEKVTQISIGGTVYEQYTNGESYHSMPVIAAHVTANARLHLFQLMQKAHLQNVFYTDTDSLIVNQEGYENLLDEIDENKLGALKIELQSPYLIVNSPKDYEMEGRKRIKGIRENAIELENGVYQQEQWIGLNGLIRQGFKNGYTSKTIVKHQQRKITSGIVLETGEIVPFRL